MNRVAEISLGQSESKVRDQTSESEVKKVLIDLIKEVQAIRGLSGNAQEKVQKLFQKIDFILRDARFLSD